LTDESVLFPVLVFQFGVMKCSQRKELLNRSMYSGFITVFSVDGVHTKTAVSDLRASDEKLYIGKLWYTAQHFEDFDQSNLKLHIREKYHRYNFWFFFV